MPGYDTLISGGVVINPGTGWSGPADVAVAGGRIVDIGPCLQSGDAAQIIDASGAIVTPGLVDLHSHVFWGGTYWGIDPATMAGRSGTTTWVDAGSAGAFTFGAFRRACVEQTRPRVRAFLNLSSIGLVAETGELTRPEWSDPALCSATIEDNRDLIVGVKCRIAAQTVGNRGIEPLREALSVASAVGLPVMVHVGDGPPSIDEVLERLRPGDIITHCATPHSMALVDGRGRLRPGVEDARRRGVLLDVGHGYGGFCFRYAEALLAEGAPPDVISSDAHQLSARHGMKDLPTCLSKYLALGMSLEEVIRAATSVPAAALGLEDLVGTLDVGRPADIAIFDLREGPHDLVDVDGCIRRAERILINRVTLLDGLPLPPLPLAPPPPWIQ